MKADWLNLEGRDGDFNTVVDRLNAAPFDDLAEIDLINDRCHCLYHTEGKLMAPVLSGAWSELYHYTAEHTVHPQDRERFVKLLDPDTLLERLQRAEIPGVLDEELRLRTVDGKWLWVRHVVVGGAENGLPEGVLYCYLFDVDGFRQRERGLARTTAPDTARRDDLTGLLLDREFFALAQEKLPALQGDWCVVAIDIENYKLFCDWHGQQTGQYLLAQIGEILQAVERQTGGLAGYRGQDDFALLIPYDVSLINGLYERMEALIVSQGDSVGFLPLFGICMIESAEEEIQDVYNRAALVAEQLKGNFRSRIRVYDPEEYKKSTEEYQILSDFQRGLDNREIFFVLQPQCHASTGRVVGAESLARWRTPTGKLIPPVKFVPVLEKHGIVTNLDKYIWESVCAWMRGWLDAGHTPVPVSVNVSQIDIFTIDVPEHFSMLLEKYRLPVRLIKIEITESAYVEDTAVVRETVRRLRQLGFTVLMDDFGSGYSSLNMLRSLNVDVIKLDAQFLRISQAESRKGISILESIISMARNMTLPVIAEGVETAEQTAFLKDLGCRYMQGYYFYRPMPVSEFENLIRDGRNIDERGIEFRAVEQFHTREFLDETVVSDVMLNNILGPVAIYRLAGDNVDIIRYNYQFYQMVGLETEVLEQRRVAILDYFHAADREVFLRALEHAAADRMNGARCVARVYKPNGTFAWISMQLYFMEENELGVHFYGACEDVTELQYINRDIPGGYHRCGVEDGFEFYYISDGFLDIVGYTEEEIREKFDNRFLNMVHPDDRAVVLSRTTALREGGTPVNRPYRLRRKGGGYVYVANQSCLTEMDDQLCFQAVAIDVDEVMKLRNQMRLLSEYSTDDTVFVIRKGNGWKFKVVVHGLERRLGMSAREFEAFLNNGEIFTSMDPGEVRRLRGITHEAIEQQKAVEFDFDLKLPDGRCLRLHNKTDYVREKNNRVEFICTFREA